ncbi:30S ribosomal protein S3 [Candidatus Vidania fulgoroideorum]
MGNKINPNCNRVFITNNWYCRHGVNSYTKNIILYNKIKKLLFLNIKKKNIEDYYLEILNKTVIITLFSYKPGHLIGKNGKNISDLKYLIKFKYDFLAYINVKETPIYDRCFSYLFYSISKKVKQGINYKFFIKKNLKYILFGNIQGVKLKISGRINGVDIARSDTFKEGKISLNTIVSKIFYKNYCFKTKQGIISIKIWYCLKDK